MRWSIYKRRYFYDEFGADIRTSRDIFTNSLQLFGYTGYQMDAVGSLYYAQARRYDANVGFLCFLISVAVLFDFLMDRLKVEGKQVTRRRGFVVKRFNIDEVDYMIIREGMLRDNIEFYSKNHRITSVWALNQPMKLLEQIKVAEGIKTKKDKGRRKK